MKETHLFGLARTWKVPNRPRTSISSKASIDNLRETPVLFTACPETPVCHDLWSTASRGERNQRMKKHVWDRGRRAPESGYLGLVCFWNFFRGLLILTPSFYRWGPKKLRDFPSSYGYFFSSQTSQNFLRKMSVPKVNTDDE